MALTGVILFRVFLQSQQARQRAGKPIVVPVGALQQRRLVFGILLIALQQLMAVGIILLLPLFLAFGFDYGAG
jgi:hypothetical protein